ncbi:MAG: hypothetical protein WBP95_08395 [Acidobacteriaceae bacterium]
MIGFFHRRTSRVLALALSAVWIATLAQADTAVTPAMHCQRGHMPCCPRSGNGESCSSARCTEQVPEKAETQVVKAKEGEAVALPPVRTDGMGRPAAEPMRELTSGLRFSAAVFRLKDDLRI